VAIVWLSLTPSPPHVEFSESDKVGHVLAYGLLMFWFAELYARRILFALGFIAMGVGVEFIQGTLGYRTFDVVDMLANTLGVLAGWALAKGVRTLLQQIEDEKDKKGS
jgi:glycopeptide antibiotics resistance protein